MGADDMYGEGASGCSASGRRGNSAYGEERILKEWKENLREHQVLIPNFPKAGVGFLDIFSLLGDAECCCDLHLAIKRLFHHASYDVIVAPEARGFIIASILASAFNKPLVPARKAGKLPGDVVSVNYSVEYKEEETLEIQTEYIPKGSRVLIVDDLIATGGTVKAIVDLLQSELECIPIGIAVVNSLDYLPNREKFPCPVRAVLHYDEAPILPEV